MAQTKFKVQTFHVFYWLRYSYN